VCYIHGHTRDEDSYRDIFVTYYGYIQHCQDSRLTVNFCYGSRSDVLNLVRPCVGVDPGLGGWLEAGIVWVVRLPSRAYEEATQRFIGGCRTLYMHFAPWVIVVVGGAVLQLLSC
jgi:hypothetical protein